ADAPVHLQPCGQRHCPPSWGGDRLAQPGFDPENGPAVAERGDRESALTGTAAFPVTVGWCDRDDARALVGAVTSAPTSARAHCRVPMGVCSALRACSRGSSVGTGRGVLALDIVPPETAGVPWHRPTGGDPWVGHRARPCRV